MAEYQVIARKFRPQTFKDVMGQEAIVTTLKNAIKSKRLAQAYLFCGSRGTGKTTLARLLAKAINCEQPVDYEPCNQCTSCLEVMAGASLNILEIDGASHRGIEDIRQINDNVGYAVSGNYKVYIIDEVHMLTKEAFNALLKTLEEPPSKVKFLFATTEPHKVPATILSRCQRFNLNRISQPLIVKKLQHIASRLQVDVEEGALRLLAQRAEGGLRDAESLFDQILAFEEGKITEETVTAILGLMPREIYFEIDRAGKEGRLVTAFEIVDRIFSEGKDLTFFIEGLIDHLRQILLIKVSSHPSAHLTDNERKKYHETAALYSKEQCLDLIEYLLEAQNKIKSSAFGKVCLEVTLMHVMRSHFRLSIDQLVHHLSILENRIKDKEEAPPSQQAKEQPKQSIKLPAIQTAKQSPPLTSPTAKNLNESPKRIEQGDLEKESGRKDTSFLIHKNLEGTGPAQPTFTTIDPTPSFADLGKAKKEQPPLPTPQPSPIQKETLRPVHAYDTLMHFAAVELEGKLQKN